MRKGAAACCYLDVHGLEKLEQALASEPRRPLARHGDVVAVERAHRDRSDGRPAGEAGEVVDDRVEDAAVVVEQIHLVDGEDEARDAEQVRDARVPPRLLFHAVPGIDQQDRDVGRRGTGRHVARVLFVARRVGEDELAARGREVAIRHVDRDALFALGPQPVGEEREVNRPGGLVPCRRLDRLHLVLVHRLRVVQQSPDERTLPIVDAARRADAEKTGHQK